MFTPQLGLGQPNSHKNIQEGGDKYWMEQDFNKIPIGISQELKKERKLRYFRSAIGNMVTDVFVERH